MSTLGRIIGVPALVLALAGADAGAAEYFVSRTGGSDSNPGTEALPWATIQKAVSSPLLREGDTISVKAGLYRENVTLSKSGLPGAMITLRSFPGDTVVVEPASSGWWGVFSIRGTKYVRLEGFEIRNNTVGWGVLVEHADGNPAQAAEQVELAGLHVHHTGGEAIQVRGNAHDILVDGCVVHDGTGGASGIDIYQWPDARGRPHHVTVRGCTAYGFPSFGGIASEQADSLTIEGNRASGSELGLDIGSGKSNVVRNNVISNCVNGIAISSNEASQISGNTMTDISEEAFYNYYWATHGEAHRGNSYFGNVVVNAGGGIYESNTKTQTATASGPTSGHAYFNNVFYNVRAAIGSRPPFYFKGTTGLRFQNNTVFMVPDVPVLGLVAGATGADVRNNIFSVAGVKPVISIDAASAAGSVSDFNCHHNRTAAAAAVDGPHAVSGDPRFADPAGGDLHLQAGSACIDVASSSGSVPLVDLRLRGRCDDPAAANRGDGPYPFLDMGAYEHDCGPGAPAAVQGPSPPANLRRK